MAVTQVMTQVGAALTAGPFGALYASTPVAGDPAAAALTAGGMGATLEAGASGSGAAGDGAPLNSGLNFAGLAAVASAIGTYLSGLNTAKKAQMAVGPVPAVRLGPAGFTCPVHSADVATFAATLAAVLNTAGNYGPAGT